MKINEIRKQLNSQRLEAIEAQLKEDDKYTVEAVLERLSALESEIKDLKSKCETNCKAKKKKD